jgi:hypothetical protein
MDPGTHSIINLVDKHGINPPSFCNLNAAFIEILDPVSDLATILKGSGDSVNGTEAGTRARANGKPQSQSLFQGSEKTAMSPGLPT